MILIPVKHLKDAKKRLSALLTPHERRAIAAAMLEDVLAALAACSAASNIALVTSDPDAVELARNLSLEVIIDRENLGETQAIAMATAVCKQNGEAETLVLPADIPLITASEIDRIFAAAAAEGSVIVPSREQRGSNAVLRRPAALFPLTFGDNSFQPHLRLAQATGYPSIVLQVPGIALDVDRPHDLRLLLNSPGSTRSQMLLREWNIGQRLAVAAIPA